MSISRQRPPVFGDPSTHWTFLALSTAVVVLSLVLNTRGPRQVVLPLVGVPLPELCGSRRMFNMDCPGCGLTRCFISLAHSGAGGAASSVEYLRGRSESAQNFASLSIEYFLRAWRLNPSGLILFVFIAAQIPYRIVQLWRLSRRRPEIRLPPRFFQWGLALWFVMMMVQWVVKIVPRIF